MSLVPASSHGSAQPAVGATIGLASGTSVSNVSAIVPFDTAIQDPSGFFNAVAHTLVVPAGLDGLYLYGFDAGADNTGGVTAAQFGLQVSGSADNLFAAGPVVSGAVNVSATGLERFTAGDIVKLAVVFVGAASGTVWGGSNGSQLWMLRVAA